MKKDFPDFVNFYCAINGIEKSALKILLEQNGWIIRKESWEDYECSNGWSELSLLGDENNPLLKGTIKGAEINYKVLIILLNNLKVKFNAELYDENKAMISNDRA